MSPSAFEILLNPANGAELIVEGDRDSRQASHQDRGYATVMMTVDLSRCADLLRERADVATATRVAELMRGSADLQARLVDLARPELAEIFGLEAHDLGIELSPAVRVEGTRILIDGDALLWLGSTSKVVGQ